MALLEAARVTRDESRAQIAADVRLVERLYPQYRKNPKLFRAQYLQSALREIYARDLDVFVLPSGEKKRIQIEVDRDPDIARRRETESYKRKSADGR